MEGHNAFSLTYGIKQSILHVTTKIVIKFPCIRGTSGALYLQPATAGDMPIRGLEAVGQSGRSGVDVWVLRNR